MRIIRADGGGALRTFNGGLAHENGWFASRKARRLLHWEGIAQLEFITRAEVELLDPEEGVSPGQACVFYEPDSTRVLGGGWITLRRRKAA